MPDKTKDVAAAVSNAVEQNKKKTTIATRAPRQRNGTRTQREGRKRSGRYRQDRAARDQQSQGTRSSRARHRTATATPPWRGGRREGISRCDFRGQQ